MKILWLLSVSLLLCFSCKEPDPPDLPLPSSEKLIIEREINLNSNVQLFEGSALFYHHSDGSLFVAYTEIPGKIPRMAHFTEDGFLQKDEVIGDTGLTITALERAEDGSWVFSLYCEESSNTEIVKRDAGGNMIWTVTHHSDPRVSALRILSNDQICFATIQNQRGCLVFLGPTGDSLGTLVLTPVLPRFASAPLIVEVDDQSLIMAYNFSDSTQRHYTYLTRTSSEGAVQWQVLLADCHLSEVSLTDDGHLLCMAYGLQSGIRLFNTSGSLLATYHHSQNQEAGSVCVNEDGSLLLGTMGIVTKFDPAGNELWSLWFYEDLWQSSILCRKLIRTGPLFLFAIWISYLT